LGKVYAEFPVIKNWAGFFDYEFKLLGMHFAGTLQVNLSDVTLSVETKLDADSNGLLEP
jgi:hypothetical protein